MSKSTEKVKKKYVDTYKWADDEVELLLTVTKENKTKQISLHSSSIIVPLKKLSHHALVLRGRVQNRLR